MPLDVELGKKMLQLVTSRYDDRHWRKKIEKTLSLPQSGVGDPVQQQIFMYLKVGLKAYKSRRADPDSWVIGGFATKEVIERAKYQPNQVGNDVTKDDVAFLAQRRRRRRIHPLQGLSNWQRINPSDQNVAAAGAANG